MRKGVCLRITKVTELILAVHSRRYRSKNDGNYQELEEEENVVTVSDYYFWQMECFLKPLDFMCPRDKEPIESFWKEQEKLER